MKRSLTIFALALAASLSANAEQYHPYYAVTTQTVAQVESEITWYFDESEFGGPGTLKLAEIDGVLMSGNADDLPVVLQAGGKVMPVVEYGDGVFANQVMLKGAEVPNTIQRLGDNAFAGCSVLETVVLNRGLRSIGKAPFDGTMITSLTIPNSVTELGGNPMAGCKFLTSISVDAGNPAFSATDGMLFNFIGTTLLGVVPSSQVITLPESVLAIADDALAGCGQLLEITMQCEVPNAVDATFDDTLPIMLIGVDATSLPSWKKYAGSYWHGRRVYNTGTPDSEYAESYTDGQGNIWSFAVRNGVAAILGMESIPSGAVSIPSSVTLPGSSTEIPVVTIAEDTFKNGSAITKITIPASITALPAAVFNGCTALESFEVADTSEYYRARYGALYSKDGKTLVKVPACRRFATTITSLTVGIGSSVIEVVNGYDSNLEYHENSIIVTGTEAPVSSTTVRTFIPAIGSEELLSGVTAIGNYAFADCGYLPTGTTAIGKLITATDGTVVSTTVGEIYIEVGTDATNTTEVTSTIIKAGIYGKKPAMWKTIGETTTASESEVPKPDVGSAKCAKYAWANSVWESAQPSNVAELKLTLAAYEEKQPIADEGATITVQGGVSQTIETGLNSESVKSVRASGLPAGLKLTKVTDKTTGVASWVITGVARKSETKTVTLAIINRDGSRETVTMTIETQAIPAWLVGEFNGYAYENDTPDAACGIAAASVSSSGKLSGNLRMPSEDGTKTVRGSFTMSGFSDFIEDETTGCYVGTATARIGGAKYEVEVTCGQVEDGTGVMTVDFGGSVSLVMFQNIWKRKDLTPPAYDKGARVAVEGVTFRYGASGKVTWSGKVVGDNDRSIRVSGSSQLQNDVGSILMFATPRRYLTGGITELLDLTEYAD